MKKARAYLITTLIVVIILYALFYVFTYKNVKEAFAKYASYADKYLEEAKLRDKYNQARAPSIWTANNRYINDMLKDSKKSKMLSLYTPRSNKFVYSKRL
jgi:F0F1-type ATP synthase membrane subunit b/b'